MSKSFFKAQARQLYGHLMKRLMCELDESDLSQSAVVFSPHPDDETLGCGGTVIKKKRARADLKIVFMTDGCRSHSPLISEEALKGIRTNEALAASRMLGVEEADVLFLAFEDEKLSKHQGSAVHQVIQILLHQQPDQIFIPYYKEAWSDHSATNTIVRSALQMSRAKAVIYEYPIWFWCHWPWASVPIRSGGEALRVLKKNVVSGLGLLRDFRYAVYIGDVLDLKRAALDQHKSQMTRFIPGSSWPTLADVSKGEFLACFFQEYEIFRRYSHP